MAENIIHPSCFEADIQCPKCGHFDKGVYCSNCSSTLAYHRLSITKLLVNLFNEVLNFEEVYISTLKSLIKRPIDFIKAYIDGDREGYSTPIKFLLINLTVCFFITNYFDLEPFQDVLVSKSERIFNQIIYEYGKLYFLLIIPIYTICTKLLNKDIKFNTAEVATSITFLLGLLMCAVLILHLISSGFHGFYPVQKLITFIIQTAIVFLLNYNFLNNNIINSLWKTAITLIAMYLGMKYALLLTHEIVLIYYPA